MNIIERQTQLGRSLYEINTSTLSEIAELSRKNVEQYFALNQSFGEKLPEVKDVSTFFELQRVYGETLWNGAREAIEAQNAILQNAFGETRDAVTSAFSQEEEAEVKAPAKKATAKKAAAKKAA